MWRAWGALGIYVALIYGLLPFGPRIGLAVVATAGGAWLLGPGLAVLAGVGALAVLVRLRHRQAPPWAYGALGVVAAAYGLTFPWLRAQHLERTHLPEYGVAAWLAWRAVAASMPGAVPGYVAAAALGAAIGYGDELLQKIVPGRVYDPRDIAMNALGAVLGAVVLAATRAGNTKGQPRLPTTVADAASPPANFP